MFKMQWCKDVIHSGIDKGWIISYYMHSVNTWGLTIYIYNRTKTVYTAFFFFLFYIESLESPKMTSVQTISEFCGIQLRIFCFLAAKKRKRYFRNVNIRYYSETFCCSILMPPPSWNVSNLAEKLIIKS